MKCFTVGCNNEAQIDSDSHKYCWACNDTQIINQVYKLPDNAFVEIPEEEYKTFIKKARSMTLPTDSAERKTYPLLRGCLKYFSAALAGVARTSHLGNEKHNPGEDMHHARGKSSDHGDCILRHLMDTEDLLAAQKRGEDVTDQQILDEANQMAWRALAYCQELHELKGAPMASGARK